MTATLVIKICYQQIARLCLRPALWMHDFCYKLISRFVCMLNEGIHPKHRILKYKEWFLDNISSKDVVLDIGCNTGMLPYLLAGKANFVYGIEIESEKIEIAKQINQKGNIEYIAADATKYDYNKCKPINSITLSNVLEHIEFRTEFLTNLISAVNWAEKDNRKLLFRVPMLERDWLVMYKKELGIEYRLDSTHWIEYTVSQFERELLLAGIQIENIETRFSEIYAIAKATS